MNLEQSNSRVVLQKEELIAKNELLDDKFSVKVPASAEGWKLFGSSRTEFLERQLIQNKKASLAHQTHNAYLNMELSRVDREMKLQVRLREQTIDRLKKEVALLRKRLFNMSKDKGERERNSTELSVDEDITRLKRKFFFNLVIGVKMNLLNSGRSCNVNAESLYEQAISEGVTNYDDYPDFIDNHLMTLSEPLPM